MTAFGRPIPILVLLLLIVAGGASGNLARDVAHGSGYPHGDTNCDGNINVTDAALILQHSAGLFQLPDGCGKTQPTNTPAPTSTNTPVPAAPTNTPTQPAVPTATATAVPAQGLERENPVPAGQGLVVPEGWEITVLDFIPDATQIVLDENQFNDPPETGRKFSIVRVSMTNVSADDPADPDATFALRLVGSENVGYTTFTDSCGVIPDSFIFMSNEVFRGGTVEGNVCYQVGEAETSFTLFTNFFLSDTENRRWFAVE